MKDTENTQTVTVELTTEQYAFLTAWQKTHEQELGIEVPIGALVRKTVESAMKAARARDEKPVRSGFGGKDDRPARPGFGGDFKSGPRKSFGARPAIGRGGPKFDMLGPKHKTKSFN